MPKAEAWAAEPALQSINEIVRSLRRQRKAQCREAAAVAVHRNALDRNPYRRCLDAGAFRPRGDRLSCNAFSSRLPMLIRFRHRRFASRQCRAFFIRLAEWIEHRLIFGEDERQYPLTVRFAGCHKIHPLSE
jgi:hypothetical protein